MKDSKTKDIFQRRNPSGGVEACRTTAILVSSTSPIVSCAAATSEKLKETEKHFPGHEQSWFKARQERRAAPSLVQPLWRLSEGPNVTYGDENVQTFLLRFSAEKHIILLDHPRGGGCAAVVSQHILTSQRVGFFFLASSPKLVPCPASAERLRNPLKQTSFSNTNGEIEGFQFRG
ncbi:hypothetical protein PoB_000826700 [Plakobranchus ocellatus]|uniref:Uncharacterized protein n=1 Tax=Plakobranchus ocellatus TaxID=259542 RepID=A0AAV3YH53_9GAST|nr:hypothetical protein PoB_000826700 [Plakobranchus ocellatus]